MSLRKIVPASAYPISAHMLSEMIFIWHFVKAHVHLQSSKLAEVLEIDA